MAASVPYIGSKISLVSNSDIRYEGILYTINTSESTIALQSVHCCGTEGRKVPEIPASSEIYDFIIFRGQDIKDLTVLESTNHLSDPAIMSVNQRPPGAGPSKGGDKGKGGEKGKGAAPSYGGGGGSYGGKSSGGGYGGDRWPATGGCSKGSGKPSSVGGSAWGGWGNSWDKPDHSSGYSRGGSYGGGWGNDGYSKGSGKAVGKPQKGMDKGGKPGKAVGGKDAKGGKSFEKGKVAAKGGGKSSSPKGGDKGGRRDQGPGTAAPIGELLPSINEAEKSKYAKEFDYDEANEKFDKKAITGDDVDEKLKPRSGYDKASSFFDNISCEATDRAGEGERPKIDRNKARQNDQETFGDTRRPPRPTGVRRGGKGPKGWGGR